MASFSGNMRGALAALAVLIPACAINGLLAFSTLTDLVPPSEAVLIGLYSGVLICLLNAWWGGPNVMLSCTSPTLAIFFSAIVTKMLLKHPESPVEELISYAFLTFFIAGCLQALFGILKLGQLVKYIPSSVVAGFITSIGIIILLKQIPFVFDIPSTTPLSDIILGQAPLNFYAMLIAIFAFLVVLTCSLKYPKSPAPLFALIASTLLIILIKKTLPNLHPGEQIGEISFFIPYPAELLHISKLAVTSSFYTRIPELLVDSLIIAIFASLRNLMALVSVDSIAKSRSNSDRVLIAQGAANGISALFGSLSGTGSPGVSVTSYQGGARSAQAGMIAGILLLIASMLLAPVLSFIPLSGAGGTLIFVAWGMVTKWSLPFISRLRESATLHKKEAFYDLATVIAVVIVALSTGILFSIIAGIFIAAVHFMLKMSQSTVRRIYNGEDVQSNYLRAKSERLVLHEYGKNIAIFEIQGAIFFASANNLIDSIEKYLKEHKTKFLLFDMKRVNDIDSTGGELLLQIDRILESQGIQLLISYAAPGSLVAETLSHLKVSETVGMEHLFDDTDIALEYAENVLLTLYSHNTNSQAVQEISIEEMDILSNCSQDEIDLLKEKMQHKTFSANEYICREGDHDSTIFFLLKGRVSVVVTLQDEQRLKRIVTYNPGVFFGELALLENKERSADVIAELDSSVLALTKKNFDALLSEHPKIGSTLLFNLSKELSSRLRHATWQIKTLEN